MSRKKLEIWRAIFVLAAMATGNICTAYETSTHAVLSIRATGQSNLSQSLSNIGLFSVDDLLTLKGITGPQTYAVFEWIGIGSILEDNAPRFVNHFYNPLNGNGLTRVFPPGIPSLTWALLPAGTLGQDYSYNDARAYLLLGLTSPLEADRQSNLALTFRSLGDTLHLIQDVAQPQHTRNDAHPFNAYYEAFTDELRKRGELESSIYSPVYPGSDPSKFNKVDNFWHTGDGNSAATVATGIGMADYSNRGFVTTGTNFGGTATTIEPDPNFPMPDGSLATIERLPITDPSLAGPVGPTQPLSGELWFIRTPVVDTYNPLETKTIRTSTYSLYTDALGEIPDPPMRFSQNRFNFIDMQSLLIPRAVGYSAGLINYFFRGQIDVRLPKDGVYAIVDHTAQSANTGGCDTPCGFRKVKLELKNSSPADEEMGLGTLRLVAKYHLNNCYRSDLSGEFGAPNYIGPACRSTAESIVVSAANPISALGRDFVESTFAFTDPIPINATDLYLQVVFQGKLGVEEGALAIATVDVREPTFLIFSNDTDFQAVYNMDGTFARTVPYHEAGASSLNLELRFKQDAKDATAVTAQLDPGFYHRIAVLTDQDYVDYFLAERFLSEQNFFTQEWVPPATVNQTFSTGQVINFPEYVTLRHTTATEWAYTANAPGAPIYWEPGPMCIDGSINCVPEDRTVDAVVRRYPPFKQPDPVPMTINF
jgi:hypothetical protein